MTHDSCEYIFSTNMWPTDARSKLLQHMNQWTSQWTHDPWWPIFDQSLTRWPIVSIVTQSRRRATVLWITCTPHLCRCSERRANWREL